MNLKSIEISKSLLERLESLPEDELEGFVGSLRLNVAESADGDATRFAADDGMVSMIVLHSEDDTLTFLTLEGDAN